MPDLISLEDEFFTEESYEEYLKNENERHNEKYRDDGENIFDALASEDADFTKTPDGKKIITAIRSYKYSRPKTKVNIKEKQMDDIMYAFQYRDLSKEAIMAMADSHLYLDHN